jgi:CYTH domain-containing protein
MPVKWKLLIVLAGILSASLAEVALAQDYDELFKKCYSKGILTGVILAEVELPSETVELELPTWVGREVTGDPAYKKINMVNARMETASKAL